MSNAATFNYEIDRGYAYKVGFTVTSRVVTQEMNEILHRIISEIATLGDLLERKESE